MLTEPWMPSPWDLGDKISSRKVADLAQEEWNASALVIKQTFQGLLETQKQAEVAESVHNQHVGTIANFSPDEPTNAHYVQAIEELLGTDMGFPVFDETEGVVGEGQAANRSVSDTNAYDFKCAVFQDVLRQTFLEALQTQEARSPMASRKKLKCDSGECVDGKKEEAKDKRGSEFYRSFELQRFRKILGIPMQPSSQQMSNNA